MSTNTPTIHPFVARKPAAHRDSGNTDTTVANTLHLSSAAKHRRTHYLSTLPAVQLELSATLFSADVGGAAVSVPLLGLLGSEVSGDFFLSSA